MATSTASTAQMRNQLDGLPVVTGLVGIAQITSDGSADGVAVNFTTDFRAKGGITVALTSVQLRMLIVNNCANADAIRIQIDDIDSTAGAGTRYWITVPGRSVREFPGYHTAVAMNIEEGDTTGGVVTLEAYFDGSYAP